KLQALAQVRDLGVHQPGELAPPGERLRAKLRGSHRLLLRQRRVGRLPANERMHGPETIPTNPHTLACRESLFEQSVSPPSRAAWERIRIDATKFRQPVIFLLVP